MADFYIVHEKAIDACKGQVRVGEQWRVALREPLRVLASKDASDQWVHVVSFTAMPNGLLELSTDKDRELVTDWNKRHAHTPLSALGVL